MAHAAPQRPASETSGDSEVQLLQKIISVITEVTSEKSFSKIFRKIVYTAGEFTKSNGETLYLLDDESDTLKAVVLHNLDLGIEKIYDDFDPVKIEGYISLPLYYDDGSPNLHSIAAHCAIKKELINLPDLDHASGYDLSKVREFDKANNYRTRSMLAIPLYSHGEEIIGVLQLINPNGGAELSPSQLDFARILASLLGSALSNSIYILSFQNLMDSVIRMIGKAIDEKSPHTAGHCQRVTELALRLANAVNDTDDGVFKHIRLSPSDLRELEIASLLHDIGKIITPQHILDKSTKLQTISDRIEVIGEKFLLLEQQREIEFLREKLAAGGIALGEADEEKIRVMRESCHKDYDFLSRVNTNKQFLDSDAKERLDGMAHVEIPDAKGERRSLLDALEHYNLSIARGTLNPEERQEMENHVSITIRLLESLPWPRELRNVTEYAGGHHENVNGTGYPNKLTGEQMSLPARILSIVDRFEGISAPDRPYKPPMPLSRVMKIMNAMHEDDELDDDIYKVFLEKKVYLDYAKVHLPIDLIDMD